MIMGPYCEFCDHRCFVPRVIPGSLKQVLMATCPKGMEFDRSASGGYDHTTAFNPATDVVGFDVVCPHCEIREWAEGYEYGDERYWVCSECRTVNTQYWDDDPAGMRGWN